MKVLLDMTVSPSLAEVLAAYGHAAVHAHHTGLDRASDHDLLSTARQSGRIVITADVEIHIWSP